MIAVGSDDTPGVALQELLALGKDRLGLDQTSRQDRETLTSLVGATRILITDWPHADLEALGLATKGRRLREAGLVIATISSWGEEGPAVMREAGDLLMYHGGGLGSITPRFANNPGEPPLRLGYPITHFLTGLNAAVCVLAALEHRRLTGEGCLADVSGQQAVAHAMGMYLAFPSYAGFALSRVSRPGLAPYHFLPCRDGWIMVICPEQHQWQGLVGLMGHPDWADNELFGTSDGRAANWDAIEPFLVEWMADKTKQELYVMAQGARVPLAPVNNADALLDSPQLAAREFFVEAMIAGRSIRIPGVPFKSQPSLTVKATESPRISSRSVSDGPANQ